MIKIHVKQSLQIDFLIHFTQHWHLYYLFFYPPNKIKKENKVYSSVYEGNDYL